MITSHKLLEEKAELDTATIKSKHPEALLIAVEKLRDKKEESIDDPHEFFCKAVAQGNSNAMYQLGCALDDVTIPNNSSIEAVKWLKAAGTLNHVEACARLGQIFAEGRNDIAVSLKDAVAWLKKAITHSVEDRSTHYMRLAEVYDRLDEQKDAFDAAMNAAARNNSRAQLELWRRYQCGIGVPANPSQAREYLQQAATDKAKPKDFDPSVLFAQALLKTEYESLPIEQLKNLFVSYVDKIESIELNKQGHISFHCSLGDKKISLTLSPKDYKPEDIDRYLKEAITQSADPNEQIVGIVLDVNVRDPESGYHTCAPFAFIKRRDLVAAATPDHHLVSVNLSHHTNNWLAVLGNIDMIMPTLLKYLDRNWQIDFENEKSGLERFPARLDSSLGKTYARDLYMGKIGIGCSCWMFILLASTPNLRPEILSVFPVIVAKENKFILRVKQINESPNSFEATMIVEAEYIKTDGNHDSVILTAKKTGPTFPLFPIDYIANKTVWQSKGPREVFASGIAAYIIRNPQESLYKDVRGIIPNEGQRKESHVYVQGVVQKVILLEKTIFKKESYMVKVRIDEDREIDLNIWCLHQHMLNGRSTIIQGQRMSVDEDSVPQVGDVVFADVWIHGTTANGIPLAPIPGTVVPIDPAKTPSKSVTITVDDSATKERKRTDSPSALVAQSFLRSSASTSTAAVVPTDDKAQAVMRRPGQTLTSTTSTC